MGDKGHEEAGVKAAVFDPDGEVAASPSWVSRIPPVGEFGFGYSQGRNAIPLGENMFLVAWGESRGGEYVIASRKVDSLGNVQDGEVVLASGPFWGVPRLAARGERQALAWQSKKEMYVQALAGDGTPTGEPQVVCKGLPGVFPSLPDNVTAPTLELLPDGTGLAAVGIVFVYEGMQYHGICWQRLDESIVPEGAPGLVHAVGFPNMTEYVSWPQVAVFGSGSESVLFVNDDQIWGIPAAQIDRKPFDLVQVSSLNFDAGSWLTRFASSSVPGGGTFVVWDDAAYGSTSGLFISPNLSPQGGPFLVGEPDQGDPGAVEMYAPAVASIGDERFVVLYTHALASETHIVRGVLMEQSSACCPPER